MTATAYSPMHGPQKAVSEERMAQILEKHTGKPFPLPPPAPTRKKVATRSLEVVELEKEQWLAHRLGEHGHAIDAGVTDPDIRRERMREAIHAVGPMVIIGRDRAGDTLTYAQAFTRLYGVAF